MGGEGGHDQFPLAPPPNHSALPSFHHLVLALFRPLDDLEKETARSGPLRRSEASHGPHGSLTTSRSRIIGRFISSWRRDVGDNIYPAFRLILPQCDDRGMYALGEHSLADALRKVLGIATDSADGRRLFHWKSSTLISVDFADCCRQIILARSISAEGGRMSIDVINELLDELTAARNNRAL